MSLKENLRQLEVERQQVVDRIENDLPYLELGSEGRRFAAEKAEIATLKLKQAKWRRKYGSDNSHS